MANEQRIMEAIIRIGGEMDNSVKQSMLKAGNAFTTLNKKCAAFEKATVKAAGAVAAAFAGISLAVGVKAVQAAQEYQKAQASIRKGTGATGEELEKLGKIARDVWKSGMGESLQEVTDALVQVEQVTGLAGKELENATKYGMLLKDTFAFELNESTRTAHALMKNFGVSAEKAYGIIAYGAQNGANKNGDMLDTLNEYSVHYKALGLTADQFVESLVKGAEAGSWSVDKVGDAVKEFTIRSKDGSKKSLEAFQMLGLNGAEMTRAFAAGGDKASEAFNKTVKAIKNMKDPVKQNAAGVALFGTMFEDLEAGMLDTMASMSGATVDAGETIKGIEDTANGSIGKTFSRIGRTIKDQFYPIFEKINEKIKEFAPIIEDLAARAMPYVQQAVEALNEHLSAGAEHLKAWAQNIDFAAIKTKIEGVIESIKNVYTWVVENKNTLMTVGGVLLGLYATFRTMMTVAAIINGITTAYQTLKTAVLAVKGAYAVLKAAQIGAKIASVASTVATWAQVAATWALNAAMAVLTSPIFLIIAAIVAVIAIGWLMYKNWDTICEYLKIAWEAVASFFSWVWDGIKAGWSAAVAAIGGAWDSVCAGLKAAWEGVKSFFASAVDWIGGIFTGLWNGIKSAATTVFNAIPAVLKTPINAIIKLINGVIEKINGIGFTIPDWVPGLGGKAFKVDIPKLPMLAAGGFTKGVSIAGEAGTEAVISFDPAYRAQNQAYLMTAAEMLGMTAAPKQSNSTINMGGLTFSPVIKTGDNVDSGNILQQLRACLPDLMDMIEDALREKEAHRYV